MSTPPSGEVHSMTMYRMEVLTLCPSLMDASRTLVFCRSAASARISPRLGSQVHDPELITKWPFVHRVICELFT